MAFLSTNEFAELCRMKPGQVRSYISRGQIVRSGKLIDDSIEPNVSFIRKRREESGADIAEEIAKLSSGPDEKRVPVSHLKPTYKTKTPQDSEEFETDSENLSMHKLTIIEKQRRIEKTIEETELLRIKREKMEGEVIPTELVKTLVLQQTKSVVSAFKNACENVLVEFAAKTKMSNSEQSRIRGKILFLTNKAIDEANEFSIEQIERIVNEFSEKRGKGENR